MSIINTLEELCALRGVSGNELQVAYYITDKIKQIDGAEYSIDRLGNIIAFKKGAKRPLTRLMLSAHMDEVGFIISNITENGMLRFAAVGGIDPRVVLGRRVIIGDKAVIGVIGTKAVHLQSDEERKTAPDFDNLYIDTGAASREETAKTISVGDTAVFDSAFVRFGDGFVKARAIDDRVGCAILLALMASELEYDMNFAFMVQEEVGLRGAKAAAFTVKPEAAIVVEATTAADIAFVPDDDKVCFLSKGPVLSFMDGRTIYDRGLYKLATKTAVSSGIPFQTKLAVAGGNDAGAIHTSAGGVKTLAVSLPCRYLHSPSCVIKSSDVENTLRLLYELSQCVCSKRAEQLC